jgi:fatty-acid desaturase
LDLHNNHHGFPRSPKFSVRSDEYDPSWRSFSCSLGRIKRLNKRPVGELLGSFWIELCKIAGEK